MIIRLVKLALPLTTNRDATLLTPLPTGIDRAHSGQEQVVLVSGEAGIGKSRLVAEAKAYAAAHDFLLLFEGHCFQTDSAFPYAPLPAAMSSIHG